MKSYKIMNEEEYENICDKIRIIYYEISRGGYPEDKDLKLCEKSLEEIIKILEIDYI